MILTYKYRIKDKSARKALCQHAIATNQVWNYCNAVQRDTEARYSAGARKRRWPSHFDLTALTSGVSIELGLSSHTIGEVCRIYAKSRNANKRALRFRSSFGARRSLGWIPFRRASVVGNKVTYCGKAYRFFGAKRRPLPTTTKTAAFVEDARGRWYVCFQVEVEDRSPAQTGQIGIDLGLKSLATLSDGNSVPALQHYRKHEEALAIAQRARNTRRVRAIHAKIGNIRRDQMHKATSKIASENNLIVIGNVSSAKLAKTRMAKSVLDASWAMFKSQIEYKARRHRSDFIIVDEAFTSQVCSECGSLPASRPKGIADLRIRCWECSDCGAAHDRDVNAARNILRIGRSAAPLAEGSRAFTASRIGTTEVEAGIGTARGEQ